MNGTTARPWAAIRKTKSYKEIVKALWLSNPISKQILGICSALAVTVQLKNAIVMSVALTFVVAFSSMIISALRTIIPRNIRIIVEVAIIATLVIIADETLKAFLYDVSKQLSVFVGLIITNCIVLGRAEGYALSNPPFRSFMDGIANGIGYSSVLIGVAFIRELLGAGKIFGYQVVPEAFYAAGYEDMGLMLLAPGAFIVIGLFVWLEHSLLKEK
ncbi:Na(+)-translocating NADH-quinone reductase subunit D (EC [Olavius algarvensis associated proteobacterium Delta 3]|nr:Na(+)-translocating NADH-quinone reductase subunit D (EC [Olavius algarvensis associated proteobacterium Delta 3]CAB5149299.1 Na(+)-translocating NADH-quinone reductase subunit D (EC [Olavius algarvensis associated proteobacterium Delta 3]